MWMSAWLRRLAVGAAVCALRSAETGRVASVAPASAASCCSQTEPRVSPRAAAEVKRNCSFAKDFSTSVVTVNFYLVLCIKEDFY